MQEVQSRLFGLLTSRCSGATTGPCPKRVRTTGKWKGEGWWLQAPARNMVAARIIAHLCLARRWTGNWIHVQSIHCAIQLGFPFVADIASGFWHVTWCFAVSCRLQNQTLEGLGCSLMHGLWSGNSNWNNCWSLSLRMESSSRRAIRPRSFLWLVPVVGQARG